MQTPFCAIMRSWTLLAAFGGSYAPGVHLYPPQKYTYTYRCSADVQDTTDTCMYYSYMYRRIYTYYIYITYILQLDVLYLHVDVDVLHVWAHALLCFLFPIVTLELHSTVTHSYCHLLAS